MLRTRSALALLLVALTLVASGCAHSGCERPGLFSRWHHPATADPCCTPICGPEGPCDVQPLVGAPIPPLGGPVNPGQLPPAGVPSTPPPPPAGVNEATPRELIPPASPSTTKNRPIAPGRTTGNQ
jgi:hypothetical protein